MKRFVAFILIFVMAASLLSACSKKEESAPADNNTPASTTPASTSEDVSSSGDDISTVTGAIRVSVAYDPEVYAADWEAEFEKAYPNIDVTFEYREPSTTGALQVNAEIMAGEGPDVIWNHGPDQLQVRIDEKLLLDMTDLMVKTDFDPEKIIGYPNQYYKYGIPSVFKAPEVVWFNEKIFSEMGIAIPDENWTIDDLNKLIEKMTTGSGENKVYGFTPYHDMNEWAWFTRCQIGTDYLYNAEGLSNYDNPLFKESLQWYYNMQKNGYMYNYADLLASGENPGHIMLAGKTAMALCSGPMPRTMKSQADTLSFKLTCRPMPILHSDADRYSSGGFFATFSINKNTKQQEAAWNFIRWATLDGSKWFANVGFVPSWKDNPFTAEELAQVVLGDVAIKYVDLDAMGKYFFDADYAGPIYEINNMTAYNEIRQIARDKALLVFTNELSVDDAIKQMKEEADKAILEAKK